MSYLIDTDRLADYLNGRPDAQSLLRQLAPAGLAISIVTYTEYLEGVYGSRNPREANRNFQAVLRWVDVLPITRTVAKRHARLRLALRRSKAQVNERAFDLLIAATALSHDLTLVTNNRRHFADIPDLKLY